MLTEKSTTSLYFLIVLVLSILFTKEANAQGCCTPGTSALSGIERGIAPYQTLFASLSVQGNELEDTFESTRRIPDPLGRSASVTTFTLELEYGVADRVSLVAIGSYHSKTRELTVRSTSSNVLETASFTGRGFGDIILLGKYRLISPTITSPFEVSLGGGAKLPTGSYEQEAEGSRLAIDLQPGSGAADLLAWGFILYSFPQHHLRLYGNVFYRYTGTNLDNHRFGDETLFLLGTEYGILDYFDLSLLLKGRSARQDFSNGRLLSSTGGVMYSLVPGAIYREGNSVVRVFYQLPIYRNVKGIQLTLTRLLGLEIQHGFDFGKE
jgi:hypothetical protein